MFARSALIHAPMVAPLTSHFRVYKWLISQFPLRIIINLPTGKLTNNPLLSKRDNKDGEEEEDEGESLILSVYITRIRQFHFGRTNKE